jgi:hypothetical protein
MEDGQGEPPARRRCEAAHPSPPARSRASVHGLPRGGSGVGGRAARRGANDKSGRGHAPRPAFRHSGCKCRARLVMGSRELLCVLCVCLSAARSSPPDAERAFERSIERDSELRSRGASHASRMLSCLVRYRSIPGGVGHAGLLTGSTTAGQPLRVRRAREALGSFGCGNAELDSDSVELSAGDRLVFVPRESVEWKLSHDGFLSGPYDVRTSHGIAQDPRPAAADEDLSLKLTRAGLYSLLVKPQTFGSAAHAFQLRVQVASGYPSARNSKACYFAPPTSNDTEADYSDAIACETFGPSSEVSFETTPGPSDFLSNKLLGGDGQNSSNVSLTDMLIDRELSQCLTRKCLTLQVRRYDSFGNKVESQDFPTEISVEIQGVDTSMYEVIFRGMSEIRSDGALKKWETYQWIGLGGKNVLGNNTCNQFACNATKLVGPETNVVANVIVRMDGVPLGHGSPFRVVVTGGGFHGFMVDPAYMTGGIAEVGGAAIRLIPVDKAGNPVKGALSHDGRCDPRSNCGQKVQTILKEPVLVESQCYRNGALTKTSYELDPSRMGPFRPDTPCSKRGCGSLIEIFYCSVRFDKACGLDGTKPFATGAADEVSSMAGMHPDCLDCPFFNGEALIARVNTDVAISCLLNMTWNGTRVQNALKDQNTIATEFFGTSLREGQSVLTIRAGEPNATMAAIRYPGANTTSKEFEGAIDPEGAFELIVTLQDSFGNPSGGVVGIVGELRHPQMILKVPYPQFNETTGGFHVKGVVTVSGQYRLQLAMEPFLQPLGGSPFLIEIAAGVPVIKNTLLIKSPETVTIDAFGQFFFQARDKWNNFVSSFHDFFHYKNYAGVSPGNKAPGFWIWVVPLGISDPDSGLLLESTLDKTGFNILRCGDDPDPCRGDDPGLEAFVAAFRPQFVGEYYIEMQYCDPRTHASGSGCDESPLAYNHTAMKPPQAPNPCQILPAGKGGARLGLACTIDAMSFQVVSQLCSDMPCELA